MCPRRPGRCLVLRDMWRADRARTLLTRTSADDSVASAALLRQVHLPQEGLRSVGPSRQGSWGDVPRRDSALDAVSLKALDDDIGNSHVPRRVADEDALCATTRLLLAAAFGHFRCHPLVMRHGRGCFGVGNRERMGDVERPLLGGQAAVDEVPVLAGRPRGRGSQTRERRRAPPPTSAPTWMLGNYRAKFSFARLGESEPSRKPTSRRNAPPIKLLAIDARK